MGLWVVGCGLWVVGLMARAVGSKIGEVFVSGMRSELTERASAKTKAWWENYVKGSTFVGVPMAGVRSAVTKMVPVLEAESGASPLGADEYLDAALGAFEAPESELKLAGILLLAEHGMGSLTTSHAETLKVPLAASHLGDWNVCDWYCVKVLGPWMVHSAEDGGEVALARARAVAGWAEEPSLWARRASAVAFVYVVENPVLAPMTHALLEVCATVVADPTRWAQTGAAWLLRAISVRSETDAAHVRMFVITHADEMSQEGKASALKKIQEGKAGGGKKGKGKGKGKGRGAGKGNGKGKGKGKGK